MHTIDSVPADSRRSLTRAQDGLGFMSRLFATMAESPETLMGYIALDGVLEKGSLAAADRQLVLTAASAANGCAYCTAAHSTFAARAGADATAVGAARGEDDLPSGAPGALIAFAHAVVHERGHVERGVLDEFLAAGFTPAHALEVVANIGLCTISNFIDGFARVELDAAFRPRRWEPNAIAAVAAADHRLY